MNVLARVGHAAGTRLRDLLARPLMALLRRQRPKPLLSLALQGGGSFGAFTWGVLDCLLQQDDIDIDVVSGASAGAVNAVLLADGPSPRAARRRHASGSTDSGSASAPRHR
jgi:NTE family protein